MKPSEMTKLVQATKPITPGITSWGKAMYWCPLGQHMIEVQAKRAGARIVKADVRAWLQAHLDVDHPELEDQ